MRARIWSSVSVGVFCIRWIESEGLSSVKGSEGETMEGKINCIPKKLLIGLVARSVMNKGKVVVAVLDEFRIQLDDIQNVFSGKSVRTQTFFDFG